MSNEQKDAATKSELMLNFINTLSEDDRSAFSQMLAEAKSDTPDSEKSEEIVVSNRREESLPDIVVGTKEDNQKSGVDFDLGGQENVYQEKVHAVKKVANIGGDEAVTTISQKSGFDYDDRASADTTPNGFIANPLTSDRGGQGSIQDTLNDTNRVARTFFDPNSVGSAEAKYKREGGRVKHGSAADPFSVQSQGKQGGRVGTGFDPHGKNSATDIGSQFAVNGITVEYDGQEIEVTQGFNTDKQARASLNNGYFMLQLPDGTITMATVKSGTAKIVDNTGKVLYVYNDDQWCNYEA